jgi:hypothetical protein
VPLLLVNGIAVAGQLAFIRTHIGWPLAGDIAFALALESIAIFLAYHAHVALTANDSALRLRLASYGFGLIIGAMNYSHYSHAWNRPTFEAVAVGLLSASSPWLWSVHSRRQSRNALMAAGLIEAHAVRLGSNRWLWHPMRSVRVMYAATWAGETDPAQAIALVSRYAVTSGEPGTDVCPAGGEHEPYKIKPGTRVTKCKKCRRSMRLPAVDTDHVDTTSPAGFLPAQPLGTYVDTQSVYAGQLAEVGGRSG